MDCLDKVEVLALPLLAEANQERVARIGGVRIRNLRVKGLAPISTSPSPSCSPHSGSAQARGRGGHEAWCGHSGRLERIPQRLVVFVSIWYMLRSTNSSSQKRPSSSTQT
eukprot:5180285-Amphidinium_carterae.1